MRGVQVTATYAATLVVLAAAPLGAQSRVSTEVDSTHVTVGDRITLTVTVEHPSSSSVAWPDSLELAPFEVLDVRTTPARSADRGLTSSMVLSLAAFELGRLRVPTFEVLVTRAGGPEESLTTSPVDIDVVSVGVDESGDIRDIRGPLEIPLGALRLALWVLLPLLLAAALFVLARRLRTREDGAALPAPGPPPRPPHEIALAALAALAASPLLERGQVKEYHIEASDILRTYVGAHFGVDAREMTTGEVLSALEASGADARFREGLGAFLDQCDLVKFAKVRPAPDASRQALELGRRIVLDSVPAPAPAEPGAAGTAKVA
jgi:hypothetical protein